METKGVPLDFLLSNLPIEEYVIDWLQYIKTTQEHKWGLRGTLLKVKDALDDVYGKDLSFQIMQRLELFYKN